MYFLNYFTLTGEIQWAEIIITLTLIPVVLYTIRYITRRRLIRKYLGTYIVGNSTIVVRYRFTDWGFVTIVCTDPSGVLWEGKYDLNDSRTGFTGQYQWNTTSKVTLPDVGEHEIYFSRDGSIAFVRWSSLISQKEGTTQWQRHKSETN
jgi:hypothetical protein